MTQMIRMRIFIHCVALVVLAATARGQVAPDQTQQISEARRRVVEPPLAALLAALCLSVVAGLILLVARLRRRRRARAAAADVDALLFSVTDKARRDPWSSIATAAVLGVLAEFVRSSARRRPPE